MNGKFISNDAVKALCEEHGVPYHHHDAFDTPRYANVDGLYADDIRNAVVVVYPAPYAPWCLAINADGTISKPGLTARNQMQAMIDKIEAHLANWDKTHAKL